MSTHGCTEMPCPICCPPLEGRVIYTTAMIVPKSYLWKPQSDITAHELALCVPMMLGCGVEHFDKLPPNAQRHWEEAK